LTSRQIYPIVTFATYKIKKDTRRKKKDVFLLNLKGGNVMAKEVKRHKPDVKMQKPNTKAMSLEEKYDRCCDFFEMDQSGGRIAPVSRDIKSG
jgi:hypothetical protein